jgi:hypothetical protein
MTVSLSSLLTATLSTGAQNQNQLTLNAINNTLTTRLNNQIAQLQAQASDTTQVQLYQSQLSAAQTQNSALTQASSQGLANERVLTDLTSQLSALSAAATAGDSATFDSTLALAQADVADLNVVPYVSGTQVDGVANLKMAGLGIQSSAAYNLSLPAGQAQAQAAITSATNVVSQITTITSQNQAVATSQSAALTADINNLTLQLSQISDNATTTVQTETANLQQQEQDQFHVIELALSNSNNADSVLTGAASSLATVLASQPGSQTASKTDPFFTALQTSLTTADQMTATQLGDAATQPSASTTQQNGINQAAAGSLLDIFS